jgi:hypothetical protein
MEYVEANEEVQQWAAAQEVSDLLPRLSEAGFITMASVCLIDTNDFAAMGIAKPGDQKRLLSAVQQAIKEASRPGPCVKPQIDLFFATDIKGGGEY